MLSVLKDFCNLCNFDQSWGENMETIIRKINNFDQKLQTECVELFASVNTETIF